MKIGFFAISELDNAIYYDYLKSHAECVWAVHNRFLYNKIKKDKKNVIQFCDNPTGLSMSHLISRIINKIYRVFRKHPDRLTNQHLICQVKPDLWVTDVTQLMLQLDVDAPRVQIFHGMPYKRHIINKQTCDYDLVMLPSKYYKNALVKLNPKIDSNRLSVVGSPRSDIYFNGNLSREKSLKDIGLNPLKKTVLLAPSWSILPLQQTQHFFPKSWGAMEDNFETFCKTMQEKELNLIIKFHHQAIIMMKDNSLQEITERYGAIWYNNKSEYFIQDPRELLFATDVLVSDVSAIITDFLPLNRPIVYINVEDDDFWAMADLKAHDRAGTIANNINDLIDGVNQGINNPNKYLEERLALQRKVFYKLDGHSTERACQSILDFMSIS